MSKRGNIEKENSYDDGTYEVKKSRKFNLLALLFCVLIAFIIWLYAANKEVQNEKDAASERTENAVSEVACADAYGFVCKA